MKKLEFRALIREEIKKALAEEENFGSEIEKKILADRLAQQRAFIAWAKSEAAKRNIRLNFNGDAMVTVSMSKLEKSGIITADLIEKWKAASEGSKENNLYQGISVLLTRYKLLPTF